jgi:hypothetical protein
MQPYKILVASRSMFCEHSFSSFLVSCYIVSVNLYYIKYCISFQTSNGTQCKGCIHIYYLWL